MEEKKHLCDVGLSGATQNLKVNTDSSVTWHGSGVFLANCVSFDRLPHGKALYLSDRSSENAHDIQTNQRSEEFLSLISPVAFTVKGF